MIGKVFWILCCFSLGNFATGAVDEDADERPYEFSFNITDFQHRFEKKDADGIVTGEFGFVTADGVYHETAYATDENDNFIITRMRNRKITSLKDALEIFKDRPEAAKKLVEAVAKSCGGCKIPVIGDNATDRVQSPAELGSLLGKTAKTNAGLAKPGALPTKGRPHQERNRIPEDPKDSSNSRRGKTLNLDASEKNRLNGTSEFPRKETGDVFYRFNYSISSHEHQEDGFRDGAKDGSYRAQSENGVDTRVKYLSNEFGHQPNISFVPGANGTEESRLKGYSFLWYWS
nr:protein lethal(3)malignant blood neoplasm 1 [Megalopta genalis]